MNKDGILQAAVEDFSGKVEMNKLKKFRAIYIGSAPSSSAFKQIKSLGINKIVNIRTPGESLPNEKELAEEAGLTYVNVPVEGCHALTPAKVREVNAEVDFEDDGKTLVYCASGNRASSWLAAHLFHDCGLTPEEAVEKAKEVGMDMPQMASETIKVLKSIP